MNNFLGLILIIIAWCLGGQLNKLWRPIAVPIILVILGIEAHNTPTYCLLPSLFYGGLLAIGNGPNSFLFKIFKEEQKVRIAYGVLLALPVAITSVLTMNYLGLIGFPLVVASVMARMGKWGSFNLFGKEIDILPTDILRAFTVGVTMLFALRVINVSF